MGLARIITRLSSGYHEIERDLRARGFQVEKSLPDEPRVGASDLEITIEECTAEQALKRAMEGGGDASVFVAPGALTGVAQASAAIPLVPSIDSAFPAKQATEVGPEFGVENAPMVELPAVYAVKSAPQELIEKHRAISDLALEINPQENVLAMENHETVQPAQILSVTQASEQPLPRNQEPTSQEIVGAVQGFHVDAEAAIQPQPQVLESAIASQNNFGQEISVPRLEALAAQPLESQPVEEVTEHESAVGMDLHSEETPLDQDVETDPVQEPVFALSDIAANSAVDAPVLEVNEPIPAVPAQLRSESVSTAAGETSVPSDWPIWQPLADPAPVQAVHCEMEPQLSSAPGQQANSVTVAPTATRRRTPYRVKLAQCRAALRRFSPDDALFWKTATLASTVAVIALLVAFSFHRFSPLPANLENPAAETPGEVQPQSSVVEAKPHANVPRAAVKTVAAESMVGAKPPLVESVRSRTSNGSVAEKVGRASSKQKIESKPQRANYQGDIIAEDTVVRYGAEQVSPPVRPVKKKPEIKRNSDMN